jgi:hypothetical protein
MSPALAEVDGELSIPGITNTVLEPTSPPFTYHTFNPLDNTIPEVIPVVSISRINVVSLATYG